MHTVLFLRCCFYCTRLYIKTALSMGCCPTIQNNGCCLLLKPLVKNKRQIERPLSEASHGQYIYFRRLPIEKLCKSRHEHLLLNHSACFFVFVAWTHMSNLDHDCTSLANTRQNKFRGSIQPGLTTWMSSL